MHAPDGRSSLAARTPRRRLSGLSWLPWRASAERYADNGSAALPILSNGWQKCDLCLGRAPLWQWAMEVKMLRFLGDNESRTTTYLMHLLSPYPSHRSALTDCPKLASLPALAERKAIQY